MIHLGIQARGTPRLDGKQRVCSVSPQNFFTPSHQIFRHIYEILNVDETITNYTDCDKFVRRKF
jgi:hypothetical protein